MKSKTTLPVQLGRILIVCGLLSACQIGLGPGQVAPVPQPSATPEPILGGYQEQDPANPEFQPVYRQAEQLLQAKYPAAGLRLTALKQLATQVVAGTNYRIRAEYQDSKGSGTVQLTMFRSLDNTYDLSEDDYKP